MCFPVKLGGHVWALEQEMHLCNLLLFIFFNAAVLLIFQLVSTPSMKSTCSPQLMITLSSSERSVLYTTWSRTAVMFSLVVVLLAAGGRCKFADALGDMSVWHSLAFCLCVCLSLVKHNTLIGSLTCLFICLVLLLFEASNTGAPAVCRLE